MADDGSGADTLDDAMTRIAPVSYTHLRAHETVLDLVCRLLLEKKTQKPLPMGEPDGQKKIHYTMLCDTKIITNLTNSMRSL